MNENNKENRSLADVEKTFYETMSKNSIFSSLNRAAAALEKLAANTETLTNELNSASKSSTKLASSLNRLTLAAVIIAVLALVFEAVKWYFE